MSTTDELLANNAGDAAGFAKGDLPLPPARKVAVLACMDARLDPARALGLEEGDAHVIHVLRPHPPPCRGRLRRHDPHAEVASSPRTPSARW
jgi:hypothetical protein